MWNTCGLLSSALRVTHPRSHPAPASLTQAAPAPAVGAKVVPAVVSVAVGLAVRFLVPCPAGVTLQVRGAAHPFPQQCVLPEGACDVWEMHSHLTVN
jgi:hypothetical protein